MLIPASKFITTRARDETEISYIPAKIVADCYQVTLEKVENWMKEGYLSGKQVKREYFVPEEEYEYLKAKRELDATEEEVKKFLGSDYIENWNVKMDE